MPGIFDEALKNLSKDGIHSPVQSSVTNNETNTDSWLIKGASSLREAFLVNKDQTLDQMLIEYVKKGSNVDLEVAKLIAAYIEKDCKAQLNTLMELVDRCHKLVESLHMSQEFNYLENDFTPECKAGLSWLEGVFSSDPAKNKKYHLSSLFGSHQEFNNLHSLQHCLKNMTSKDLKNNELGIVSDLEKSLEHLLGLITKLDARLFNARVEMKHDEIYSLPQ